MKEQIKTPKAFVERQTEMQEESTLGIQHLLESIHIHAKYFLLSNNGSFFLFFVTWIGLFHVFFSYVNQDFFF